MQLPRAVPWAPMPGLSRFLPFPENIFRLKVSGFPDSGVGCGMEDKAQMFKKPMYGSLPAIGLPVQVQCDGFKCMAFRDREGRWVDLFTHQFVPRVLGVVAG